MTRIIAWTAAVLAVLFLAVVLIPVPGIGSDGRERAPDPAAVEARMAQYFAQIEAGRSLDRPFPPMPMRDDNPTIPAKVDLGRLLYFDPVLSGDNTTSCAHCHHPDLGFADNRPQAMGVGGTGIGPARTGGTTIRRNTPTVWNAAFNHRQYWDGREPDLEAQAAVPIQHPDEMAQDAAALVDELRAIPAYAERFDAVFGGEDGSGVTFTNVAYAIGAFERTILSQDSRYDRYARGETHALTAAERRGLALFRSLKTRCFECHNLPTFANPDFKVIGVPSPDGTLSDDRGRGEIVGDGYEHAFKVPTLRNVALTAPYMHNGVFETLGEVVDFYAAGGGPGRGLDVPTVDDKIRPFALTPGEKQDLIAFLHALTDESAKPDFPEQVPSGLPVVPRLPNQSPELAAFEAQQEAAPAPAVRREGHRLIVQRGERIQPAIDAAQPGDTVWVEPGVYYETLTLDASDLTLLGVERDGERPVLDGNGVLSDGLIGSGRNLEIRGFDVKHYTANGVMINLGTDLVFRDLYFEDTGLYGLYPVESVGILIERCIVTGARDAGIYVGQAKDVVVRDSEAYGNVTGIEIENTLNAVVEDNEVYDNAGGILVFLLPNNPSKISRQCIVRNNRIVANNHVNFADPTAVVSNVPSGTGVMLLAADDVEVVGNEIRNNQSVGIATVGLDALFGAATRYDVDPLSDGVWIHGNVLAGNGTDPDPKVTEAGFDGADLVWDLTGEGNRWDQPGASRLPYTLPGSDWSALRRRANHRLWSLLIAVL